MIVFHFLSHFIGKAFHSSLPSTLSYAPFAGSYTWRMESAPWCYLASEQHNFSFDKQYCQFQIVPRQLLSTLRHAFLRVWRVECINRQLCLETCLPACLPAWAWQFDSWTLCYCFWWINNVMQKTRLAAYFTPFDVILLKVKLLLLNCCGQGLPWNPEQSRTMEWNGWGAGQSSSTRFQFLQLHHHTRRAEKNRKGAYEEFPE